MFKNPQNFKDAGEKTESIGRFWGVSGCRATLSATTSENPTSDTQEMKDIINELKGFINEKLAQKTANCWIWNSISFVEFVSLADSERSRDLIARHHNLKWQQLDARIALREASHARTRLAMSAGLRAMQYKRAKAKKT